MPRKPAFTLVAALAAVLASASALAQPANDNCAGAIPIGPGLSTGSTVDATTGPEPTGGCASMGNDVWYLFIAPCTGPWVVSTCDSATFFDTTLAVWDGTLGCASPALMACNDDACSSFGGFGLLSVIQFETVAGTPYLISVAGFSGETGSFALWLYPDHMRVSFIDSGPGTLGYKIESGPTNGAVFTAMTLNGANYPYGWFYGIDISIPELYSELGAGFPFMAGPLDACGSITVGPFSGLPSGLTVYGVSFGFVAGDPIPSYGYTTYPADGTVP